MAQHTDEAGTSAVTRGGLHVQTDRRSFIKYAAVAGGALAIPGLVAACSSGGSAPSTSSGASGKPVRLAFTHPAAQSQVVSVLTGYAQERMKGLGGEFTVGALPNATPEAQYNLIQGWIAQQYDAIVVFPLDPKSLAPLQKQAQAKKIKWITYLVSMPGDDGLFGGSVTAQGDLLAKGFLDWVKKTGYGSKALVLSYSPLPGSLPRVMQAVNALKKNTNIEIVSTQDSVDTTTAQQITENTLRAHPDLDVVLCLTDDAAAGAVVAMDNAKTDVSRFFVGGCDGTKAVLEDLLKPTAYKASAAVDLQQSGYLLAQQPVDLVLHDQKLTPVPATLLTPADKDQINTFLSHAG